MSTPQADLIARLVQRVLQSTESMSTVELGASLGVDSSYITKLRQGWRPSRMRPEILKRFEQFDPSGPRTAAQPPAFYDGVLYAAQAMAETQARLIAEARAGLAARFTPAEARAELDEAEPLLQAAERQLAAREARPTRGRRRA